MTKNTLLAKIEQLKAQRPELARRAESAVAILTAHFNDRAARIIRARIAADGQLIYTVKSLTSRNEYTVTYNSCDCPDHARRGLNCKHMLAIRALESLVEHRHGESIPVTVDLVEVDSASITAYYIARADAERRARGRCNVAEEV